MKRRQNPREDEAEKYRTHREQFEARWHSDRAALLEESTDHCPFCDRALPPRAINRTMGQWIEPSAYDTATNVFLVRRTSCGCEAEREAVAVQLEQEQ